MIKSARWQLPDYFGTFIINYMSKPQSGKTAADAVVPAAEGVDAPKIVEKTTTLRLQLQNSQVKAILKSYNDHSVLRDGKVVSDSSKLLVNKTFIEHVLKLGNEVPMKAVYAHNSLGFDSFEIPKEHAIRGIWKIKIETGETDFPVSVLVLFSNAHNVNEGESPEHTGRKRFGKFAALMREQMGIEILSTKK